MLKCKQNAPITLLQRMLITHFMRAEKMLMCFFDLCAALCRFCFRESLSDRLNGIALLLCARNSHNMKFIPMIY